MIRSTPFAMARPKRPIAELEAVQLAASGRIGSAREVADAIAREVAARTVEEIDRKPDPFLDALAAMAAALDPSAVSLLATCPEIDTGAFVRRYRASEMEARGGTHLPEAHWAAERREVEDQLRKHLARRYRDLLK